MNRAIISVDSGGTKTKIVLLDKNMNIVRTVYQGSGSPAVVGEIALDNIYNGILELVELEPNFNIEYIIVGMSAMMSLSNPNEFIYKLENKFKTKVVLVSDTELALYSVIKDKYKEGIMVLSGTGSGIVSYKDEVSHLVGGWGHLLTEVGSAFSVVRTLIVNAIRLYEEKRVVSDFTNSFIKHLGLKKIEEFRIFIYKNTKREIAAHANFITEAAINNIQEAISLLENEGRLLANDVNNAYRIAGLSTEAVLGFRGGFIRNSEIVRKELVATLESKGIRINILKDDNPDPIFGGYYLAKKDGWRC